MHLNASPWLVISALAIVLACLAMGSAGVLIARRLAYKRQRGKRRQQVAARESSRTGIPDTARGAFDKAASVHKHAVACQERYHAAVAAWATCLLVAFTAVALGVTLVEQEESKALLAWIDAIALLLALAAFFVGRFANRVWIDARIMAELLRQNAFLSISFPGWVESDFRPVQETIDGGHPHERFELAYGIREEWRKRRDALERVDLGEADLTPEAINVIIERRAERQLLWFENSHERLEREERRRTRMLLVLYCVAAVLAVLKVRQYLGEPGSEIATHMLSLALLMTTGVAAAATGLYFSQNSRSLMHRYRMQQTQVERWLETVRALLPDETDRSAATLSLEGKQQIQRAVLDFETLMVEELIDWVYITRHDAIEIAP